MAAGTVVQGRPKKMERTVPMSPAAAAAKKPKWLLVASGKGGSGKTSTSLNLAVIAANAGFKVCLVDLDTQRTLAIWHERRKARSERIAEILLWQGELTHASRAINEIGEVEELDLVIIDTPPSLDHFINDISKLVARADLVLVPTQQGQPDIDSVVGWMKYLHREKARATFVINRAQRTYGSYQIAKQILNKAGMLCPMDIRQLEDVQACHSMGLGVREMAKSKAEVDFRGVWDFVCGQLGIEQNE
jgi:chromosome partitioning protein